MTGRRGTYVGNYTDEHGNIVHEKHPWSRLISEMRETERYNQLLTLEFYVLRAFLRRFPGESHVQLTPVEMVKRMLPDEEAKP